MGKHRSLAVACTLAFTMWLLAGCETTTTPVVTDETSPDGLVKVNKTGFDQVWVRKGADLSQYTKIKLEGVGIEYRPVKCGNPQLMRSSASQFCLNDDQKKRLVDIMQDVFTEELGKSTRFKLTDQTGPDVLLIRGALIDVVSYVPPEPIGRSDIFLNAVGEATLIFEMRDSASNAILARVADRRAAERAGDMPMRSTTVTNSYEVERAARAWASLMRQRLDNAGTLGSPNA
jgi:hypothetical protein